MFQPGQAMIFFFHFRPRFIFGRKYPLRFHGRRFPLARASRGFPPPGLDMRHSGYLILCVFDVQCLFWIDTTVAYFLFLRWLGIFWNYLPFFVHGYYLPTFLLCVSYMAATSGRYSDDGGVVNEYLIDL